MEAIFLYRLFAFATVLMLMLLQLVVANQRQSKIRTVVLIVNMLVIVYNVFVMVAMLWY